MDLKARLSMLEAKYGFRPSPILDQYFLTDEGVHDRITRYAELNGDDVVLEIGPGTGFLTAHLLAKASRVVAVEKDLKLEPILGAMKSEHPNLDIIYADFLEADLPKFTKCVSNIPYSISAPITFRLLDYGFEMAVLMYQKEFAEKMVCEPGDPDYGRLSVMAQYYYDTRLMEVVNKMSFTPMPKVDSAIIRLRRKSVPRNPGFDAFVREMFRYKNKDTANAIRTAFGKSIDDTRKVRHLDIHDLLELHNSIK